VTGEPSGAGGLVFVLLYLLGMSVVEPLLVACGFALYVNRRIFLEGWDIELAFRRLASRTPRSGPAARSAAALAVLVLAAAAAPARADAPVCAAADPAEPASAAACIEEILASDEFGSTEERSVWRPREVDGPGLDWSAPSWLGESLAAAFQVGGWVLLGGLLLSLAVAIARRTQPASPPAARAAPPSARPARLFGLDLAPERLPDDPTAAARRAWDEGRTTLALSLLYRSALVRLVDVEGVEIPESATELECIALVARAAGPARAFRSLTEAWIGARYAARPPGDAGFEELCRTFEAAFGARP
jgi:hypothetical protein